MEDTLVQGIRVPAFAKLKRKGVSPCLVLIHAPVFHRTRTLVGFKDPVLWVSSEVADEWKSRGTILYRHLQSPSFSRVPVEREKAVAQLNRCACSHPLGV